MTQMARTMISKETLPRIRCAICNKLVDSLEVQANDADMTYRFRVFCHGQTDQCDLDRDTFLDAGVPSEGIAFTQKQISQPRKELAPPPPA